MEVNPEGKKIPFPGASNPGLDPDPWQREKSVQVPKVVWLSTTLLGSIGAKVRQRDRLADQLGWRLGLKGPFKTIP